MAWQLTDSLDEFERTAGDLLHADPVRQTVPLSVLGSLRHAGPARFGDGPPIFGWHRRADGSVDGAVLQTPPYPLLVASLPTGSAGDLLALLHAKRDVPTAANVASQDQVGFLAAWAAVTGGGGAPKLRSRLHQLGQLVPPDPAPGGAARRAGPADRDLLIAWHDAFQNEALSAEHDNSARTVDDRLSHDGLLLWEASGEPVAMAGLTRADSGVARVAGVYTVPAERRHGYGAAITTAATQTALAAGAAAVVLFTDLANPTSNALYHRLGYRMVEDRTVVELTAARRGGPGVTGSDVMSS
jgi:RimJ/RimL family protein N-acetyltransferase